MSEYATYKGEEVKIGTCENMYYLRFDQRFKVQHVSGNVNPASDDVYLLRFRFPWPGEDHIEPGSGEFHDNGYHKGVTVYGFDAPSDADHGNVQFVASEPGYNVCLPCPEGPQYSPAPHGYASTLPAGDRTLTVHRNGFRGSVQLVGQKLVKGIGLVPILRCGGCGTMWREEDRTRIEELAVCFRSEGDRRGQRDGTPDTYYHAIADRLLAGLDRVGEWRQS